MAFSPDGRQLVLAAYGSIRLFDLISGQEVKRIPSKEAHHAFGFDPGGRRLAVICQAAPRDVQIYDLESSKVVTTLSHTMGLDHPTWSPDGHFLVATAPDRCLYVLDVRTGKQQAVLRGHEYPPNAAAFSHSGDLLASTGWDGTLRLWQPMTGRLLLTVPGGGGKLNPRFSPDDRLLGCTTTGSEVELWEVAVGVGCRLLNLPLTDGEIHSTAFSRDGLLASASFGGVRVWDSTAGREVCRLPIGETRSVLFHPTDGSLFTSGSRGVYRWPAAADRDSPHALRIGPPQQLAASLDTWQMASAPTAVRWWSSIEDNRGRSSSTSWAEHRCRSVPTPRSPARPSARTAAGWRPALSGGANPPSRSGTPGAAGSCATCPGRA